MQALDSFFSPIHRFEGDIAIPVIPISAQSPSGESASDLVLEHERAERGKASPLLS
jgi:hypothetical protein